MIVFILRFDVNLVVSIEASRVSKGDELMSFKIFSSTSTWEKNTSKRLEATEVEDEEQAEQKIAELLKQGHRINSVMKDGVQTDRYRRKK